MDQRFSKARVAKCGSLTALTSGRTETPTGSIKSWASLKKATSADTCPDTLTDSFQILATERRPSPKPHTNREETQSFSCPETKGNPTWISLAMGITSDPRSWWSSSMWMSLSPNFEPLRIVYTTTTDDFSAVPTTAPAAAMPASTPAPAKGKCHWWIPNIRVVIRLGIISRRRRSLNIRHRRHNRGRRT